MEEKGTERKEATSQCFLDVTFCHFVAFSSILDSSHSPNSLRWFAKMKNLHQITYAMAELERFTCPDSQHSSPQPGLAGKAGGGGPRDRRVHRRPGGDPAAWQGSLRHRGEDAARANWHHNGRKGEEAPVESRQRFSQSHPDIVVTVIKRCHYDRSVLILRVQK